MNLYKNIIPLDGNCTFLHHTHELSPLITMILVGGHIL